MTRRLPLILGLVLFALFSGGSVVGAGTAWAHAGGLTSSSSEPVILGVEPPVPGLDVRVVEAGARLRLDNGTSQTVVVEPPPGTAVNALPVVPPGETAFWSDPRIAWAAGQQRADGERLRWEIPVRVGETPVTVAGEQYWPPAPNAAVWWLLLGVAIAVPAALTSVSCRRARRRPGAARREFDPDRTTTSAFARGVLTVSTLVLICAHLVHVYGSALVPAQGEVIWLFLGAAGFAVIAWPLGLAGAYHTMRRSPAGPLLCLVAGALIAVIISPADIFSFYDAVVPYAWGADFDRFLIALNVGGGLGVITAATILMRDTAAPNDAAPNDAAPNDAAPNDAAPNDAAPNDAASDDPGPVA